jgi:hypothetical protein
VQHQHLRLKTERYRPYKGRHAAAVIGQIHWKENALKSHFVSFRRLEELMQFQRHSSEPSQRRAFLLLQEAGPGASLQKRGGAVDC